MLPFVFLVASYFIGALPFGYLTAQVVKGIDIRQHGSGNIGATNVGRVLGWPFFVLVFALDFLKGAGTALLPLVLNQEVSGNGGGGLRLADWQVLCGLAALLGHMFPIYLGFRGGKGVATGAGVVTVVTPLAAAVAFLCWLVTLLLTRFVSLSSIMAALMLCIAHAYLSWPDVLGREALAADLLCLSAAALVILRHRSNIARLLAGTEPRIGEKTKRAESAGQ